MKLFKIFSFLQFFFIIVSTNNGSDLQTCYLPENIHLFLIYDFDSLFNMQYVFGYESSRRTPFAPIRRWMRNSGLKLRENGSKITTIGFGFENSTDKGIVSKTFTKNKEFRDDCDKLFEPYVNNTVPESSKSDLHAAFIQIRKQTLDDVMKQNESFVIFIFWHREVRNFNKFRRQQMAKFRQKGVRIVFVYFVNDHVTPPPKVHTSFQNLKRHSPQFYDVMSAMDEVEIFEYNLRSCQVHESCPKKFYKSSSYYYEYSLLRSCVVDLFDDSSQLPDHCVRETRTLHDKPMECRTACDAMTWSEWKCACDLLGTAVRARENFDDDDNLWSITEYCWYRETKRCSKEMMEQCTNETTEMEFIMPGLITTTESNRIIIALGTFGSVILISLLTCFGYLTVLLCKSRKKEETQRQQLQTEKEMSSQSLKSQPEKIFDNSSIIQDSNKVEKQSKKKDKSIVVGAQFN